MEKTYLTKTGEETERLGEEFAKELQPQDVVFLVGELGTGKTTFVKGVAKGLGIKTRIISPTFVLIRRHVVSSQESGVGGKRIKTLYHLDLYRLSSALDVKNINLDDYLSDETAVTLIEWPEVGQELVKKKVWKVNIEHMGGDVRRITLNFEQ